MVVDGEQPRWRRHLSRARTHQREREWRKGSFYYRVYVVFASAQVGMRRRRKGETREMRSELVVVVPMDQVMPLVVLVVASRRRALGQS